MKVDSTRLVDTPVMTDLLKRSGVKTVADARALLKQARKRLKEMGRVEAAGKLVLLAHREYLERQITDCLQMLKDGEEEERGCLGKERYPSQAAAEGALRFFRSDEERGRAAGAMEVYGCRFCGSHHLGHAGRLSTEAKSQERLKAKRVAA